MIEYTCILCPRGCRLTAEKKQGEIAVSGNACPRGEQYAVSEMTNPMRTVTTSVYVTEGDEAMVSVKTSAAVPKAKVEEVLKQAAGMRVKAPLEIGDILIENVAGTGENLVATRKVIRICSERKNC